MTVTEPVESIEPKRFFAFRDQMLGENQNIPATSEQLCAAGLLIYGHEALYSLYGLPSFKLAAQNFTVLGRTVIESCIDAHAETLALRVRDIMLTQHADPEDGPHGIICDLFCGSGNISFHLQRHLGYPVFASDMDSSVYNATKVNLALLRKASESNLRPGFDLSLTDYRKLLVTLPTRHRPTDIYIIEPPWGRAFTADGLDLTQTQPPVQDIIDDIRRSRAGVPCYIILKTVDQIAHDSLRVVTTGTTFVTSLQCLPKLSFGVDFHIYVL